MLINEKIALASDNDERLPFGLLREGMPDRAQIPRSLGESANTASFRLGVGRTGGENAVMVGKSDATVATKGKARPQRERGSPDK